MVTSGHTRSSSYHDYKRRLGLTTEQRLAIELLLTGISDARVAEKLNLARETVTRWRLRDPYFTTELNRRRTELWAGAADALRGVLPLALESMTDQLKAAPNRGRLALDLFFRSGLLGTPATGGLGAAGVGPTDLDDLLDQEVRRQRASNPQDDEDPNRPITDDEREAALTALLADATLDDLPTNPSLPEDS